MPWAYDRGRRSFGYVAPQPSYLQAGVSGVERNMLAVDVEPDLEDMPRDFDELSNL